MEILGYLATFCIGLVLGLIGGGGSLLAIPILVYLFSFQVVEATSYSLVIVGITSLFGACQRFSNECVDVRAGITFGIPSIITIFLTRKFLVPSIPDTLITIDSLIISKRLFILGIFAILIIGSSYVMITKNIRPLIKIDRLRTIHLMLQGALIGVLTGIVGIGGGFLIIPALVFLAKLPFSKAVGTTLLIIAMKSIVGFAADSTTYNLNWGFIGIIIVIAVAGIITGNLYSKDLPHEKLKKSFGWFTLVLALTIIVKESIVLLNA